MATSKTFSESSSSASSSSKSQWNRDVFLSFRGEETRKNFTDHLYAALTQAGISTFRDSDELSRGEDISMALIKAIHESRIAIPVFSKGYASSLWCLAELAEIIKCKNTIGQIVIPIFYNVDPSDVRKQTGGFGEAFDTDEEFKKEMEEVKKWREALTEAAELSGWNLQNIADGYESIFIQKVVEDVLSKLNYIYLNVAKYPVGIESRVKDVIFLLSLDANVGIRGMGGIGKTTIAKAVFNQLCHGFEGSCSFLSDVREVSEQPNGLVQLQKQLIHDILKLKNFKVPNIDCGINLIKERLRYKRVLIVLDDLDQLKQVDALVGDRNWFGPGSRIIITTRDAHLLDQLHVGLQYEVRELNRDESLQLFSWQAFMQTFPVDEYMELSNDVVDYVGGLPLALEVLGSYLCKRSIPEWKSAAEKLRNIPHHHIQKKLRISFDTLDDDKIKDIFLDIACFFTSMDKDYVVKILEGCGFYPEIGISILIGRSLLTIDSRNKLVMHQLLQDMGREIIREISPNHPGKRSRLWFHQDVLDVLKQHKGTEAVEGLMLDARELKDVFVSTESFSKMRSLRLLQINAVHLTGPYENIFYELRWLRWHECPLKCIPTSLQLGNLVVLEMQGSNIREFSKEIKVLGKLQILDLSHSVHLAKTPNFSGITNLERLILEGCRRLVEVHQSIGHLKRLVSLNLEGCKNLNNLPESICYMKSLETLNIAGCSRLGRLPEHLGNMEALTELLAERTAIKQLPSSIGHLKNLTELSMGGLKDGIRSISWFPQFSSRLLSKSSKSIAFLPPSFAGLSSLTRLVLADFGLSEDAVSIDLGRLYSLVDLDLRGNNFSNLPFGISRLPKLKTLWLNDCRNLKSISDLPSSLKQLLASNCTSMERLSLQSKELLGLSLINCPKLVEIQGLESVETAPIIQMQGCNDFKYNPNQALWQAMSKCEVLGICFSSCEIPDWCNHQGDGSLLSFYVPEVSPGNSIVGVMVWIVYAITDVRDLYKFAKVKKVEKNCNCVFTQSLQALW
ncbi:disease resistance protein RPV1-like isoform X2 [Hevea brasiliensis]|uniref:disease resistance protein RPV1-like isoform X2 n=1 Tax=Hevea brasiliensis TaxID=3981 RepID=UPI0025FE87A2|nr:disease resistance protein RPV1-like isoform X2 [Hevea brasiliensis]